MTETERRKRDAEKAKSAATPVRFLVCPFCDEKDFDTIGLKAHLNYDCAEYDKTPLMHRMF